ncbi:BadF/BadG/BcrA/BcrD ATPase family protein [Micromonospora coxensis]|uniref:BadF/BadG/BcrA/BcrD ATPase family protein n=1 Tax=Micromonospora coxensis TaxID=356852 RepID=UPI00341C120F
MRDADPGTATLVAIDAGGSHTRVLAVRPDGSREHSVRPSVNPHATGPAADRTLHEVFAGIGVAAGAAPVLGWLASAALDPEDPEPELTRLRRAAETAGLSARLVVSNDVVPLLWGVPALAGAGIALVCGTGSGFLGVDRRGTVARAGGCEYLGSDEGGAVDIGRQGLCAAVRALDGRGPRTALVSLLTRASGVTLPALARAIAAQPYPKQRLADLAPLVCAGWRDGDAVCADILDRAATELVTGVRAVRRRLSLPAGFAVATVGGVFSGCPPFQAMVADRLRADLGAGHVEQVDTSAETVLGALRHLLTDGRPLAVPAAIDRRHAWILTT